jgi:hypothetical protein
MDKEPPIDSSLIDDINSIPTEGTIEEPKFRFASTRQNDREHGEAELVIGREYRC